MTHMVNRRQFLGRAALGGAALSAGVNSRARADSPNEEVVVGIVGMSRGLSLARDFVRAPGCRIKHICDIDSLRAERGATAIGEATGHAPKSHHDFRHILEDPEVDAMVFALPVHWHAPAAILACQAGKHVYVEKPCSHNPHEGELIVEAARKHKRAVQMGTQRRSSTVIREAIQRLQEGVIGRHYYARCWYAAMRGAIGRGVEAVPPEHLDYNLWQGPAPRRPYKDNVLHYNWHWLWHWGTGELGNNGTHGIDLCRWGLGVEYPTRVSAAGGRYRFEDDQETPDTHMVTWDFADGKTISWEGLSCNVPGAGGTGFGATFYGEEGSLTLGSTNYLIRDNEGKVTEEHKGDLGGAEHVQDFLNAIRRDAPLQLHAEILEGHRTTLLAHLGNIAYRTGRTLQCGARGHITECPDAQALWRRDYEPGWEPVV